MKKALIHNPYWDSMGGGERYTTTFVKFLLDHGWSVDIDWPENISSRLISQFGIDISGANFIKESQDFSLVFWVSDGSLPTFLSTKTIIHFQFPFTNINGHSLPNFFKSRLYTFVCNSAFTKSCIDSEFNVKSHVVYPPISIEHFSPGVKTNTILYVGRFSHLTQLKNPDILIKSFRAIKKQLPGWKLKIAGGVGVGTPTDKIYQLKELATGLPVQIIPNPSLSQLQKLYSEAKLFWSASGFGAQFPLQVEHFGITVVEAMAAGCVPIITNLGGHKEIINSGIDGLLWDTEEQLQDLTRQLIRDQARLSDLSQAAIQKSKIFSVTEFNNHISKLI